MAHDHPQTNRDRGVRVYTLERGMMDVGLGPVLSLWQSAGLVVLLITCANIANLLLARGAERGREIAVRLALGSSRGRIVRESLVESLVLAFLSVPLSLGVTWIGLRVIRGFLPARLIPFVAGWDRMGVDGRTITFTVVLAAVAALGFGSMPALQISHGRMADALKSDGRTGTSPGRERLRRWLVMAEIALTLPLLVAAMLSVNGVRRYLTGWQGYDHNGILTLRVVLPESRYPDTGSRRRFAFAALDALAGVAGTRGVAVGNVVPSIDSNASRRIDVAGQPVADATKRPVVDYRAVSPAYFDVLRIPVLDGRAFSLSDQPGAADVAIVSQSMARKHWPTGSAVGGRVRIGNGAWMTVVGVCGDVIHDWFDRRNAPTLYRPLSQAPQDSLVFAIRAAVDPLGLAHDARRAFATVDPVQPVFDIMPMDQVLREKTIGIQFIAGITGTFAALALILAVLGLYAVMTYRVTLRVREIGVRMALGATAGDVTRLALGQAARLTAIGVAIGLAFALGLGRLMEAGLLGIVSSDARMSALLGLALGATALVSSYLPARRAAAVDPIVALRSE